MSVSVHLPAVLRDLTDGRAEVVVDGATVRDVLVALDLRCPGMAARLIDEHGALLGHVLVFVDGDDVRREAGLATIVRDGAQVTIQHAMSGG